MAKSFLQELRISLEDETLVEGVEVTPEEEAEADVAYQEAEAVRQEIEAEVEASERAEAVVEELEGTNEAVQAIIEEKGELSESEAALVEAQRRTAAAALNLDPEEGAGAELVDQAGLEAMVTNKGTIALEANEGMIAKIKAFIESIGKKVVELWNKFKLFVAKVFNVLPSQLVKAKAYLDSLDEATLKEAYGKISDDEKFSVKGALEISLGFAELDKYASAVSKLMDDQVKMLKQGNADSYISLTDSFAQQYNGRVIFGVNLEISADKGKLSIKTNPTESPFFDQTTIVKAVEVANANIAKIKKLDSITNALVNTVGKGVTKALTAVTSEKADGGLVKTTASNQYAFTTSVTAIEQAALTALRNVIKAVNLIKKNAGKTETKE